MREGWGEGMNEATENKYGSVEKFGNKNIDQVKTQADFSTGKDRSCQKCLLEESWSEDVIKLTNLVSYGPEYILSLRNSHNNP